MKGSYEPTQPEITEFQTEDFITTFGEPIDPLEAPKGRYMVPIR